MSKKCPVCSQEMTETKGGHSCSCGYGEWQRPHYIRKGADLESAKIVMLKAQNVKRLSAVEIHPDKDESLVVIGGENAQGKTSVLDSIMYALAGGKSIPEDVVKHGEKQAVIELDLGELIVNRTLGKGAKLEVKYKDGRKMGSPQKLLDDLAGKLTFDPLHFQRLSETTAGRRQQAEILRELIGLDFTAHENQRKALYDQRTDVNRDLKRIEGHLESLEYFPDAPKEPVSASELVEELQKATDHNRKKLRHAAELDLVEKSIDAIKKEINKLQKELEDKIATKLTIQKILKEFNPIDDQAIREKLQQVEQLNDQVQKNKARNESLKQQSKLRQQSEKFTEQIEDLDKRKQEALNNADMPIEGLSFTEEGVIFNKVPFENCSSAEQLKLSVAMGIKMNPKLKIMLIRDGSLLDDNSLETLREMASKAGQQVWLERVGKGEECTVVIEDGTVLK